MGNNIIADLKEQYTAAKAVQEATSERLLGSSMTPAEEKELRTVNQATDEAKFLLQRAMAEEAVSSVDITTLRNLILKPFALASQINQGNIGDFVQTLAGNPSDAKLKEIRDQAFTDAVA
jgi:hypothetical protein